MYHQENQLMVLPVYREVDYAKNNSLIFPGLQVDSLDFYINDYDILSSVYGRKN